MSQLDEELAQAVQKLDAEPRVAPAPQADRVDTLPDEEPKRNWALLAGIGVVMAGVLTLFFTSNDDAVVYAYGVDEVVAKASQLGNRQLRVEGFLVSGTLVKRDAPCEYRFDVTKGDQTMHVRYAQCVVPDTFRDVKGVQVDVNVEGRLAGEYLEASKIIAKCPSKYEMQDTAAATGMAPDHGGGKPKPEFIAPRVEAIR
jgi:cytochrome c-type biogenesis protein CcmE